MPNWNVLHTSIFLGLMNKLYSDDVYERIVFIRISIGIARCQTGCSIESFVRMHVEVRKKNDRLDVPSAPAWRENERVLVSQGEERVARLNRKERVDTCRERKSEIKQSAAHLSSFFLSVHTRDPSKRSHVFFNKIRDNKRIFRAIEPLACLSFLDEDEMECNGRVSDKSSDQWAHLQSLTNSFFWCSTREHCWFRHRAFLRLYHIPNQFSSIERRNR